MSAPRSSVLRVRDMDTMRTSASRLSVLSMENLSIMITSTPQRVYILIICKLMTLIIRELSKMSVFLLRSLLILWTSKSSTPTINETHVHEENISDVQDILVDSSTLTHDDINVSKDETSDFEHVLVKSSMFV